MQKAVCLRIEHIKGTAEVVENIEPFEEDHYDAERGFFKNKKHGEGLYLVGPKIILYVFIKPENANGNATIRENEIEIHVEKFFKEKFTRLTKRNVEVIYKTMPVMVEIEKTVNKNRTEHYKISEKDLNEWFARCEEEKRNGKRKKK